MSRILYSALVTALLGVAAIAPVPATAAALRLARPGEAARTIASAAAFDTVELAAGVHRGPLVVDRAIVLRGRPGAIVDGGGHGSVIEIRAGGVTVRDLGVRGSGRDVMTEDAGVRVISSPGVRLAGLEVADVLYGIYGERATGLVLERCMLRGRVEPRAEIGDGNGIHLWYCEDVTVRDCAVERFLDAVYLSFTHHASIENSRFHDSGRYGLHTMYCQENRLTGNLFTRNVAGCAIMFSNHLVIEGNDFVRNRGSRTYGVLLRDCSDGNFRANRMLDNTIAIFMDNSNRNRFEGTPSRTTAGACCCSRPARATSSPETISSRTTTRSRST